MSDIAAERAAPSVSRSGLARSGRIHGARLRAGLVAALLQGTLLATGIIVARALGPADRGALATAIAVGGVSGGIATLGLEYTAGRSLRAIGDPSIARGVALTRAALAVVAAPLVAGLVTAVVAPTLPAVLVVASAHATALALRALPAAATRAAGDGDGLASSRLIHVLAYAIGVVTLVVAGAAGAVTIGFAYAGATVLAAAFLARRSVRGTMQGERHRPPGATLRADLASGARHTVATLLAGDLAMLDVLVFGWLVGPAAIGTYAACRAFANLGYFTAQTVSPTLATRDRMPGVHAATVGMAAIAALAGLVAAPLLLGPAYTGSDGTSLVLGVAGGIFGLRLLQSDWYRMHRVRPPLLPPETAALPVLLLAAFAGTAPVLLAAVFAASQAAALGALVVVNRREVARCAS